MSLLRVARLIAPGLGGLPLIRPPPRLPPLAAAAVAATSRTTASVAGAGGAARGVGGGAGAGGGRVFPPRHSTRGGSRPGAGGGGGPRAVGRSGGQGGGWGGGGGGGSPGHAKRNGRGGGAGGGGNDGGGRGGGGGMGRLALPPDAQVMLIGADGSRVGTVTGAEAIAAGHAAGLDAVVVSGGSGGGGGDGEAQRSPMVVRLMDLEAAEAAATARAAAGAEKAAAAARASKKANTVKELRVSPSIGDADLEVKLRAARAFLEAGRRVRLFVIFRRGQAGLGDTARALLASLPPRLADVSTVQPRVDRRPPAAALDVGGGGMGGDVPRKREPLEVVLLPIKNRGGAVGAAKGKKGEEVKGGKKVGAQRET
ncbi:hypothetical protein MMPV_004025 [Pyropia vietnamensis]